MKIAILINSDKLLGSCSTNDGNFHLISNRSHRDIAGREVCANLSNNTVIGDQLAESVDGVCCFAFAVHCNKLKLFAAENTTVCIDFLNSHFCAVFTGIAPECSSSGQVGNVADFDHIVSCEGRSRKGKNEHCNE